MKRCRVLLSLGLMAVACSPKEQLDIQKPQSTFSFFFVENFDLCLQNLRSCLVPGEANTIEDLTQKAGVRLVKLEPTSRIYQPVALERIRPPDRKTLAGSGFFTALRTLARAREQAQKASFSVPGVVHVDATCTLPYSQNNAYFRPTYGIEGSTLADGTPAFLHNVLCLGQLFSANGTLQLAADPFVVAHEYFHAVFATALLGEPRKLPDVALTMSHDLDAFNEGAADFFAEAVTRSQVNRIFSNLFPWRTRAGRKHLPPGLAGNIYRDGTRYTELFSRLEETSQGSGLATLSCSLKTMGERLQNTKASVDALDEKAGLRSASGLLERLHLEAWGFGFSSRDLLDAISSCVPAEQRETAALIIEELFGTRLESKATEAEVFALVVPSLRALCGLQKVYGLSAHGGLRHGLYLDACAGAIENTSLEGQKGLSLAKAEVDAYNMERRLFESVYVLPGVRLKNGQGLDCRLQTLTLFSGGEVSLTTVTGDPSQPLKAFFNMEAFSHDGRRGSWYRDIPLGDLRGGSESYLLSGPLAPVTAEGYRFTSWPTEGGRPTQGLHGYFWIPVDNLAVSTRLEKHAKLAQWVKSTLQPYALDAKSYAPCAEGNLCREVQNVDLICRSHSEPLNTEDPEKTAIEKIRFTDVKVGLWDCTDTAEGSCALSTY